MVVLVGGLTVESASALLYRSPSLEPRAQRAVTHAFSKTTCHLHHGPVKVCVWGVCVGWVCVLGVLGVLGVGATSPVGRRMESVTGGVLEWNVQCHRTLETSVHFY